ncbi:MAG: hypothetical protein FJZ01_20100 [Candidatus Sericytochromatia bacterium]|nr:hypothetical protein [Candidatus Tanganyikabacteria bacterium]
MKRSSRVATGLAVLGTIAVAACGQRGGSTVAGQFVPDFRPQRIVVAKPLTTGKTGTLQLRARLAGFRVQDVPGGGFTILDVHSLLVTVKDSQDNVLATATLTGEEVDDQLTVSNLPVGTIVVLVQARNAEGMVISVDAQSMASVIITESGVSSVTLSVQLGDLTQQGESLMFNGIAVVPGALITPGAVTIATASPTPAPTPTSATTPTPEVTPTPEPMPTPEPTPTPPPTPTLSAASNNVIASATAFTLASGTYLLKVGEIAEGGASATWSLWTADGMTLLGSYTGSYSPGQAVTVDTAGTSNVGMLTFNTATVPYGSFAAAQDQLTVSQ